MAMVTIIINRMKRVISPIIRFLFSISHPFLPENVGAYLQVRPGRKEQVEL